MTTSFTTPELSEHFAHCIQVFGGTTAASRRLDIDERAIRRFINGERPLSAPDLEPVRRAVAAIGEQTRTARERSSLNVAHTRGALTTGAGIPVVDHRFFGGTPTA